jgi:hypothetical protein
MDGVIWFTIGAGLCGIVFLARLIARDPKDVPHQRASWMGPDIALLEVALFNSIAARAASTLARRPEIDELARHHAFDMAARNFLADRDPEGVDHDERRRRLHPELVGRSLQAIAGFSPDAAQSPESFAAVLLEELGADFATATDDPMWTELGVGVAVERGRGAVCVVLGQAWAELTRASSWGPDSGWEVEGKVFPGTQREQLSLRLLRDETPGSPNPAGHEIGWDADRFRLQVDVSGPTEGTWLEILRDGIPGLRRRLL